MKNRLYVLFIMAVLLLLPVVSAVAEITVSGDMAKNAVSKDVAELAVLKDSIRIDAFEDMFADLDELRQPELADVTGQVGITIDMSIEITDGYLSWGDSDGFDTNTFNEPAYLTLSDLRLNNGQDPTGPLEIVGLTIDAGTDNARSYILIGMPRINGRVSFDSIKIGTDVDEGGSMGSLCIGDLDVSASMMKITSH